MDVMEKNEVQRVSRSHTSLQPVGRGREYKGTFSETIKEVSLRTIILNIKPYIELSRP